MDEKQAQLEQRLRDAAAAPAVQSFPTFTVKDDGKIIQHHTVQSKQGDQLGPAFFDELRRVDLTKLEYRDILRDAQLEQKLNPIQYVQPPPVVSNKDAEISRLHREVAALKQQYQLMSGLQRSGPSWPSKTYDSQLDDPWAPETSAPEQKKETMLAKILRLYYASMAGDIRSPLVHLVGPPGCGKSTSVEQAADVLGVKLHILNVSRISPLEIEGVQMPVEGNTRLEMLLATFWNELNEGDIVLLDEFLRGFPEVYNGLLDILTSRRVGKHVLPKVFFIAASNSTSAYDKALEDRLLHLPVDDPRNSKQSKAHLAKLLIEGAGLHPDVAKSYAMDQLLDNQVLPMFEMLDLFKGQANISAQSIKGKSIRHLVGSIRMRQIEVDELAELISASNSAALSARQMQFYIHIPGTTVDPRYVDQARKLVGNNKLTEIQAVNLDLNLQLVEMEEALKEEVGDGHAQRP